MMTGPDRPVRQPANTRASVLLPCFLRLAAFADADDSIVSLPGSLPAAAARSGRRIVRAVGRAYTAAPGNWAPASRPVRAAGGVYTGRRYDVVRKEGAQDGDSRSALTGAGRGWRGVPGADRVP